MKTKSTDEDYIGSRIKHSIRATQWSNYLRLGEFEMLEIFWENLLLHNL